MSEVAQQERAAFTSLAKQLRRQSNEYRRWAIEAEGDGNLNASREWASAASLYRDRARWYLDAARRRTIH